MRYGYTLNGVSLERDVYAEQFADPKEIKTRYWVTYHSETLAESEKPKELAAELQKISNRLSQMASFLRTIGHPRPDLTNGKL